MYAYYIKPQITCLTHTHTLTHTLTPIICCSSDKWRLFTSDGLSHKGVELLLGTHPLPACEDDTVITHHPYLMEGPYLEQNVDNRVLILRIQCWECHSIIYPNRQLYPSAGVLPCHAPSHHSPGELSLQYGHIVLSLRIEERLKVMQPSNTEVLTLS